MDIYIYNLVFLSAIATLFATIKNKNINTKMFFVVIACLQLIIIQGLRAQTVGTDVAGYINIYNKLQFGNFADIFDQRMEVGFCFLVKIISLFEVDDQIYLSILSAFIIIPVGYTIYKYSRHPFLSFYLYITFGFYTASFCAIRQHIAYGIIFLTLGSIRKRKLWKFVFLAFLAITMHKSAIIFLPAYFLSKIRVNKISIGLIPIIFMTVFTFRAEIVEYAINSLFTSYEIVESSSYMWMLLGIILFIFGLLVYKQVTINKDNHIYYTFMVTALLLMSLATITDNAMRMVDYYYIFLILYIPAIVDGFNNKSVKNIIIFLILGCSVIVYYILLSTQTGYGIVPYEFFW